MAAPKRNARVSRRRWLLAGGGVSLFRAAALAVQSPALGVTWDGDNLHVSAPRLHFLSGKPLERLRDGATVVFLSQLTVLTDGRGGIFRRVPDRLVVSYDLWEEKFSVTRLGGTPRSVSHLSAAAAEAWCLETLLISASGLTPDRPFWVRLELRTADPREVSTAVGEPGISITRLIDIFSRKPGAQESAWTLEAGPLRLADLARTPGRGTRNG
jgi:hypothetical protein